MSVPSISLTVHGMHEPDGGEKTLVLSGPSDVIDLTSGDTLGRGLTQIEVTLRAGDTR